MSQIAFFIGDLCIYWFGIIMAMAAGTAAVTAFLCRKAQGKSCRPICVAAILGSFLSLFLSRFIHWYCCEEQYDSLLSAMTDLRNGGFSVLGVFLGCFLAVMIVRWTGLEKNSAELFDCLAPAGAVGICIGRLGAIFTSSDRGKMVITAPAFQRMPFAVKVGNEWQFATFVFEAFAAAVIFAVVMYLFSALYGSDDKRFGRSGDIALIFLAMFGSSQAVLESTRYDALFLRSNGFISMMQVLSSIALVAVLVVFSVRAVKLNGFKPLYLILWVVSLLLVGGAMGLEYLVQRYGDMYVLCYAGMIVCMMSVFFITFAFYRFCCTEAEKAANAAE